MDPHTKLGQAVLEVAVSDATHRGDAGWIGIRDFRTVCTLAGFEPEAVADAFRAGRCARLNKTPNAA